MNGASDENAENRFGEENEENEQFLQRKGQRKFRPHALAYRNTNISGSVSKKYEEKGIYVSIAGKSLLLDKKRRRESSQQRNQEPPTRSRWLPTGISAFTVFCDEDNGQEVGSSKDSEKNDQQQGEGSKRSGEMSTQYLQVPRKIRRPLATLSPNHDDSDSEGSRPLAPNLSPNHEESDLEDSTPSDTNLETDEGENSYHSKNSTAASIYGSDISANELRPDDEVASDVDSVSNNVQRVSKSVPDISSQAATTSSSIMYTTEEHEDRMRTDPVYDADIYLYMRYRELKLCPSGDFLEFQEEICGEVRHLLVEWICDSAREFNLSTESLHMAVSIVDRVLNTLQCPREKLQLLGAAALLLAAKFEEIYPPEVKEFARITAYTFHETEIIRMERIVFARVEYQLLAPTSWWFASRLVRMAHVPRIIYCMMRYLLELALLDHTFLDFRPSVVGAASFFLSNVIFKSDYLLLTTETDIGVNELRSPARKMLELFHEVPNKDYCSVFEKYATEKYEQVSCLLLPDNFSELDVTR
ncbi:cyclin domain-containing protein [Wuchereria bancrofti]|uniref:Cyclin domain-containing protein n=1 Tax=Wuchereria bancrofti TaxID=6293 RepID=J9BAJ1_WUCBA|nr:cyclin domain-containing protein [Wuchereria bancrofti]